MDFGIKDFLQRQFVHLLFPVGYIKAPVVSQLGSTDVSHASQQVLAQS